MTKTEQDLVEMMNELSRLYKSFNAMKESNKILQETNEKLTSNIVNLQKENAKLKQTILEQWNSIHSLKVEIQDLIYHGRYIIE